jgi:ankyrin repeat protein
MGWPSTLTYKDLVARGVRRSVNILACYGDVETAAAVFADDPAQANDPEALASAAGGGHANFVHLMLRYQPDLPRRISIVAKTPELTRLLFEHGMAPNLPNWLGITPLHRFAERGDIENAAIFIDHGADLNPLDDEFRSTPLGYAAKYGQTQMAQFLLERGADPSLPHDPAWAKPIAWAQGREHREIVRILTGACQ